MRGVAWRSYDTACTSARPSSLRCPLREVAIPRVIGNNEEVDVQTAGKYTVVRSTRWLVAVRSRGKGSRRSPGSKGLEISECCVVGESVCRSADPRVARAVFVLQRAACHRSVGRTDMNERSSRSHSIFTLYLRGEPS